MRAKGLPPGACLVLFLAAGCDPWGDSPEKWPFTESGEGLTDVASCSLAWGDCDNDGDLDLAIVGHVTSGDRVSSLYRNEGGGNFSEVDAGLAGISSGSLAWGDYDGDGDLDLALAGWDGSSGVSKVYRNDGNWNFTDVGAGLTDVGGCSLAWGDYDNDGDLDLALAGENYDDPFSDGDYTFVGELFRNDGNGTFTNTVADFGSAGIGSLCWGDYDNDGDLDLAMAGPPIGTPAMDGLWAFESDVYCNDGDGVFTPLGAELTGVHGRLAWGDCDNDGDLDLALAGSTSWYEDVLSVSKVYGNDGGSFTDLNAGLAALEQCSLAWGDYDSDGDLDLALAGDDEREYLTPASKLYRNSAGTFVSIGAAIRGVEYCSLAWGDYDDDGDLDLALAGLTKGPPYSLSAVYRNDGNVVNTAPAAPTGLSATPGSGGATFSWDPATDAETPQPGLTYNLRVGTASGRDDVMPSHAFIGGAKDGRRLVPAMGNVQHNTSWTLKLPTGTYYWSVQAIDTAFCGSPWAPELTVTVP